MSECREKSERRLNNFQIFVRIMIVIPAIVLAVVVAIGAVNFALTEMIPQ